MGDGAPLSPSQPKHKQRGSLYCQTALSLSSGQVSLIFWPRFFLHNGMPCPIHWRLEGDGLAAEADVAAKGFCVAGGEVVLDTAMEDSLSFKLGGVAEAEEVEVAESAEASSLASEQLVPR